MRILFLTHRLPYAPNRGDRIRAYHMLRLLGQAHRVDLVSLIDDRHEMAHIDDLRGVVASVTGVRVSRIRNALCAAAALPGRRPLTHLLLHGAGIANVLREAVVERRPDLVFAYCTGMARYALEPPLQGFPLVLDMVDVDSEKWAALGETAAAPRRWIYRREARTLRDFERHAVERASATLVATERERVLLQRIAPRRNSLVLENGVDVDSFAPPAPPPHEPRVVFCGVFDYPPNEAAAVWMAREVWPRVRRLNPEAQLTLVGMRPTRSVQALAGDPSINVTGAVPDVKPYLWKAGLSVAPIWVSRGVQNKVLEAIAAGLPCVVTPPVLEGLPMAARPACRVAGDPDAFADAVHSLLHEPPDARRRIARSADLSRLTWAAQLSPLLGIVEAAAASAGSVT